MQKTSFSNSQQALQQARRACSKQEKCKFDIIRTLQLKNINENDIEKIISQLINEKFIDETRYTNSYVRDKLKFQQWGKIKISYELNKKGISEKDIQVAFNTIDENKYINILKTVLEKKLKTLIRQSKTQQKAKLVRYAASKGYENDLIYREIEKLINY